MCDCTSTNTSLPIGPKGDTGAAGADGTPFSSYSIVKTEPTAILNAGPAYILIPASLQTTITIAGTYLLIYQGTYPTDGVSTFGTIVTIVSDPGGLNTSLGSGIPAQITENATAQVTFTLFTSVIATLGIGDVIGIKFENQSTAVGVLNNQFSVIRIGN